MSDGTKIKTIVLGKEYDQELRDQLEAALEELGAESGERQWGVAGSQELENWEVILDGNVVTVECETYIGLSLVGHPDAVDRIAAVVESRVAKIKGT